MSHDSLQVLRGSNSCIDGRTEIASTAYPPRFDLALGEDIGWSFRWLVIPYWTLYELPRRGFYRH